MTKKATSNPAPGAANPSGGVPIRPPFSQGVGVTEEEMERSGYPETKSPQRGGNDPSRDTEPRPAPQTDPTNPQHQEAVGIFAAAEQRNEDRVAEPGLTEEDRVHRSP
jgi:hypothetical protein